MGTVPERRAAGAERAAVLDLGSNSTRYLVADVRGGDVEEVARGSEVTRLMRGVDLCGQLSSEAIEEVCSAVSEFIGAWEPLEPDRVIAYATSAVRDASNGDAFLAELRERFDLSPSMISGEEEAELTYRGATAGRNGGGPTLVIDIGGGSTELIMGSGEELSFSTSLKVGVVRQTERHLKQDPPSAAELEELADEVRSTVSAALEDKPLAQAEEGIGVAGTATSLAGIDLSLDPYEPERAHRHRIALDRIQRIGSELAAKTTEERKRIPGLHPGRAPTIVAGVVILTQMMRAFGLDEIEISERDLLHGAALEAVKAAA